MAMFDNALTGYHEFVSKTIDLWREMGIIKPNPYGVVLGLVENGKIVDQLDYYFEIEGGKQPGKWYFENALGKAVLSAEVGLDSVEITRLHPGLSLGIDGVFPWGGAVVSDVYPIVVGVSGGAEDEDDLIGRTILAWAEMQIDRAGRRWLDDALSRGTNQDPAAALDRFTRK